MNKYDLWMTEPRGEMLYLKIKEPAKEENEEIEYKNTKEKSK